MTLPVFKIAPGIQSYDWGKRGSSSLAAQLATESVPDFEIDENKTYAEVSRRMLAARMSGQCCRSGGACSLHGVLKRNLAAA